MGKTTESLELGIKTKCGRCGRLLEPPVDYMGRPKTPSLWSGLTVEHWVWPCQCMFDTMRVALAGLEGTPEEVEKAKLWLTDVLKEDAKNDEGKKRGEE